MKIVVNCGSKKKNDGVEVVLGDNATVWDLKQQMKSKLHKSEHRQSYKGISATDAKKEVRLDNDSKMISDYHLDLASGVTFKVHLVIYFCLMTL